MNLPSSPVRTVEETKALLGAIAQALAERRMDTLSSFLDTLSDGLVVHGTRPPSLRVYRARIIDRDYRPSTSAQVSYAPVGRITKRHRVGAPGEPVFYACLESLVSIAEVRPNVGDFVVVSEWESTKGLALSTVGFGQDQYQRWGKTSKNAEMLLYQRAEAETHDPSLKSNSMVLDFIYEQFTKQVQSGNEEDYFITGALAKLMGFGALSTAEFADEEASSGGSKNEGAPFDGLLFPSIEGLGRAENVAIRRHSVDKYMSCKAASVYEVTSVDGVYPHVTEVDFADVTGPSAMLSWKGRPAQFSTSLEAGETLKFVYSEEQRAWISQNEGKDLRRT
jgi:hypothetical protein